MASLADVARETVAAIERGDYPAPRGHVVSLRPQIAAAVRGTQLYRPAELDALLAASPDGAADTGTPRVEVTAETTAEAGRRLVETEGRRCVVALNFASAMHPGGGFLRGARAQEEDLARSSALYACLRAQPEYYDANRAEGSALYTDHVIYSPSVPFFRDERMALLDEPFAVSVITAPAPNAGEALRRDPNARDAVRATLARRAGKVLAVAADRGDRCLVLGAWGCGVFRNDPHHVAEVFAGWLRTDRFRGAFDEVVFAVYDRSPAQATLSAFHERFRDW
ncbi:MAG TPA: TIGR02452 family protein [Candidatus Dormibacteraeota bacterium]